MTRTTWRGLTLALLIGASAPALTATAAQAQAASPSARPWLDAKLDADKRADLALAAMTNDEKFTVIFGYFGADMKPKYTRHPDSLDASAGYVAGVPRLGIPGQWQTDAGVGVATQGARQDLRARTALPAGIATAATWNPELAETGGAMIGKEARDSGFNVQLAGGVNLVREPRNGRNFEYGGEDPWLAGVMVAAQIRGIQSNNIISTIKHYALNAQETGRFVLSANIGETAARTSDLLAFQFAIEQSDPHSVMCAYNRFNGTYACENDWLLNTVLKKDWGYKGYVMSDWGAAHTSAKAANAGLDQESAGDAFDKQPFFAAPLKALRARYPNAKVVHDDGTDPARAAKLAAESDLALVFADQWTTESVDAETLNLPKNQDATIDAVASANKKTVVVLITGGPVVMPWLDKVGAVIEAWYPGTAGGEAIARVLTGEVDASGRLPVTFPKSVADLPRPKLDGDPKTPEALFDVNYDIEGAAVGYKWYDLKKIEPLFPFGHGLSYTRFTYSNLSATAAGEKVTVSFDVKNTGARAGKDVPQVYVSPKAGGWEAPKRLAGFKKVSLAPGATQRVTLTVDSRLLATWDEAARGWSIAAGQYDIALGASSKALVATAPVTLTSAKLPVSPKAR